MLAAQRVKNPMLLDLLRQWVEDKFHLPWNHEAFQEATVLELLTDFWEDYYRKHPLETKRTDSGEVIYANTGDSLIDKWEQELARGIIPDLYEGLPSHKRAQAQQKSAVEAQQHQMLVKREEAAEGFSDDYRLIRR